MAGKFIVGIVCILMLGCKAEAPTPPLKVGFNTWPGYEFIYLAQVKDFYRQQGVDVKLVELNSLGDVRRAFERGQIDIMASTLVELATAAETTRTRLTALAITDASLGADKLIAPNHIRQLQDLRGKRIGAEPGTVDTLVVAAALRHGNIARESITFEFATQDDLVAKLEAGTIDAIQTYPPYTTKLLAQPGFHVLFDTREIPDQIFDVLSARHSLLSQRRGDVEKFLRAYFLAVDYFFTQPQESAAIMAQRQGISGDEFLDAISTMKIYTSEDQAALFASPTTRTTIQHTLEVLRAHGWLGTAGDANDFLQH